MNNENAVGRGSMITELFAVPVYMQGGLNIDGVSDYLQTLKERRVGSDNGFCTIDQQILNHEQLHPLRYQILQHIKAYILELKVPETNEFYINCSWGMRHEKGDWAHPHKHHNSLISGIVYIDCDEKSGSLNFHKDWKTLFPPEISPLFTETNSYNTTGASIIPEKGQIILFPAHLDHSVSECESDDTRRCIAFNSFIRGVINDNRDNKMSFLEIK